jgi:hypothetical protein
LHGGTHVGGWTAKEIHQAVRTTFGLSEPSYGLNQLRYDLRKLKGHGLLERDGSRYAYASPQRVFKSPCYFCSSTNGCADHLPTAASTAVRTLNIAQTADSKSPTTAPTRPSRISSICSPPPDAATSLLESSCLTSLRLESSDDPLCVPKT